MSWLDALLSYYIRLRGKSNAKREIRRNNVKNTLEVLDNYLERAVAENLNIVDF